MASPSNGQVRTKSDILPNETLDFETICYDGNLPHIKPEFQKGDISQMSEEQTRHAEENNTAELGTRATHTARVTGANGSPGHAEEQKPPPSQQR